MELSNIVYKDDSLCIIKSRGRKTELGEAQRYTTVLRYKPMPEVIKIKVSGKDVKFLIAKHKAAYFAKEIGGAYELYKADNDDIIGSFTATQFDNFLLANKLHKFYTKETKSGFIHCIN